MTISMVPAERQVVTEWDLVAGGQKIGVIKGEENSYRVIIKGDGNDGIAMLYQGTGDTPDAAVSDLLDRHERFARAQLRRLEELRGVLAGGIVAGDVT